LGFKPSDIRVVVDKENLGEGIALPVRIEKSMDILMASLSLENPERYVFKNGIKANLGETLAAIRLLRRNVRNVERGVTKEGKMADSLTAEAMKSSFNMRFGLEDHGIPLYTSAYIKAILAHLTKPSNDRFPGAWISSLRRGNECKSDSALLHKLGYQPKAINPAKLFQVVMHKCEDQSNQRR